MAGACCALWFFQSRDVKNTIGELVKTLVESPMSVAGDRYLFAGWHEEDGFRFQSHIKT